MSLGADNPFLGGGAGDGRGGGWGLVTTYNVRAYTHTGMAGKHGQAKLFCTPNCSAQGRLLMALRVGVALSKGEGRQQVGAILQRQLHKSQTLRQVHHLLTCRKMCVCMPEHAGMRQDPSRHWASAGPAYTLVGIHEFMLRVCLS